MTMADEKSLGKGCLDWLRHGEGASPATNRGIRLLWLLCKAQRSWNPLLRLMLHRMRAGYGLEMSRTSKIRSGFYVNCGAPVAHADASAIERDRARLRQQTGSSARGRVARAC